MGRLARRSTSPATVTPNELTASQPIDLAVPYDVRWTEHALKRGRAVARSLWDAYKIAEVHYAVSRGARTAGYAKIKAYKLGKDGRTIEGTIDGGQPAEIAEMFSSPFGGQRALCDRFFTLMKVPGDSYLAAVRENHDGSGDIIGYHFLSSSELRLGDGRETPENPVYRPTDRLKWVTSPTANGGGLEREIRAGDVLGRVWRSHGEYVDDVDSPLISLKDECELIVLLTKVLKSRMRSRFAMNGIFFVPSEIKEVKQSTPTGKAGAAPVFHENAVLDALIRAAVIAMEFGDDDILASLPTFMTGPGQFGEMIKHIVQDETIFETDLKLRADLVGRVNVGLDIERDISRGTQDANHWGAWAIEDNERRVNIQPELESMCWAGTRLVLRKQMLEANQRPGTINRSILWYDLSAANVKTNLAEDARQAIDRGLMGPGQARQHMGFGPADAPSEIEQIRWFGTKYKVPFLAFYKMPEVADWTDEDWEKAQPQKTGPGSSGGDDPESNPGQDSGSPNKQPGSDAASRAITRLGLAR